MRVTLDKSRDGKPSLELYDLRAAPDVDVDLGVSAHGDDRIVLHGQCLRFGEVVVHCDDLAAAKHQVRGQAAFGTGDRSRKGEEYQRTDGNPASGS